MFEVEGKKRHRPPRIRTIQTRVQAGLMDAAQAAAKREGLQFSTWIRQAVEKAAAESLGANDRDSRGASQP